MLLPAGQLSKCCVLARELEVVVWLMETTGWKEINQQERSLNDKAVRSSNAHTGHNSVFLLLPVVAVKIVQSFTSYLPLQHNRY